MEYLIENWNQIAFAVLGVLFGLTLPPDHFWRFIICLSCYVGALALAVYTL